MFKLNKFQYFSEKIFNKKRKGVSPLIASILLIVVAISIIVIIFSWGRSVTDENLEFTDTEIYDKSNLDGFITQNTRMSTNNLILENLHTSQSATIIGYKIHSEKDAFYLNKYLYLEEDFNLPSITIQPNQIEELYMACFPERDFSLELVLDDATYLTINIRNNNFNFNKCTQYTVLFLDYDDSIIKEDALTYGQDATPPEDPTRIGHTFTGWLPADFTNIIEDTNFTAQYTINTYSVLFLDHDESVLKEETVNYSSNATPPEDPTRTGHTFDGWSPSDFTNIIEDTNFTAEYTINSYSLSILKTGTGDGIVLSDLDGINCGLTCSFDYNYNTEVNLTASTEFGNEFMGWSGACSGTGVCNLFITEDININANFVETTYSLYAWGNNSDAQLGDDRLLNLVPKDINLNFDYISAGNQYSLGIRDDGELYAWGYNYDGRTGLGTTSGTTLNPTKVGSFNDWNIISIGSNHSLGIRDGGKLYAWGNNSSGQLGDSTTSRRTTPIKIGEYNDWEMVSAGITYSLGIRDGKLYSWGGNQFGKTGLGTTSGNTLIPTQIGSFNDWEMVSAGSFHSLGIRDGELYAWGRNSNGQTGLGTTSGETLEPTQVEEFNDWEIVSAGSTHSLGIRNGGELYAWGNNGNGRLGDGTTINRTLPVKISDFNDWEMVSAGTGHSLGIRDGKLYAWGNNSNGGTGLDSLSGNTLEPTQVGDFNDWKMISAGNSYSLGIRNNNEYYAWGDNYYGQLGNNYNENIYIPTKILDYDDWKFISLGRYYSLGIRDGKLYSWGRNDSGVLGVGDLEHRLEPTRVGDFNDWRYLSTGKDTGSSNHNLGLRENGEVYAWGSNRYGKTGLGTTSGETLEPTQVGLFNDWEIVSAGGEHSLGIRNGGELYAWGRNSNGQLGDGTIIQRTSPVKIGSFNDWEMVSAGGSHSLGIRDGGELYSWGFNSSWGLTGLGLTSGNTLEPTRVGDFDDWEYIFAERTYSFGIRAGKLYAWGNNSGGKTGLGTISGSTIEPTRVGDFDDWEIVSAAENQALGIRYNGELYAWGSNSSGQLGDGTTSRETTPFKIGVLDGWAMVSAGSVTSGRGFSMALLKN